jgi:hypothetical protein
MKHSRMSSNRIRNTAAVLVAAGMLWMGSTQCLQAETDEHETCSNAAAAGAWAYTETGTVAPATGTVPFAAVARYTLDEAGNLAGTATSSSGGSVSNVTLKGTGTVNAECTSTLTVGVYSVAGILVRTATFALVYVDNEQAARALVSSLVLASGVNVPAVLTVDARKLFDGSQRER